MTTSTSEIDLQIADYKISSVATGFFALDGGAMFGTVPKVLWQKTNPTDENNRIQMEARALLLRSEDRTILIDTGNGSDFVEKYGEKVGSKFAQNFGVQSGGANLLNSLSELGVHPEDVTDVIFTHLHFDHAGGATRWNGQAVVPTFPRATYHVQETNLANAEHPNLRERASYLSPNFKALIDAKVLKTHSGTVEIFPGVTLGPSDGHTVGQQTVRISDSHQTLLYCGDLIPTSTHVRLAWVMGYDINPLTIMAEKEGVLTRAVAESWLLFFEHDPICEAATVERNGSDFQIKERFRLLR